MSTYRYTDSGLDNVIIEGVDVHADDAGEECITIPNVNGLHQAIAYGIVNRRSSMTGRELRFLRTEMGMTQAELAAMLHREALAVSRWERGEVPVDANAEALVRLYAVQTLELPGSKDVKEIAGWCVPSADTPPLVIDGSDPENYRLLQEAA
ncbi:transcriptional regulator with XRE-family HTH domain [Kaistia hirudinis]|uniref:Transcriptional regulator with XRE-family HTH domain n=1 Tax=Kaistia hirudinis TaxID=1293440 RepID=A0A840AL20_9HYPH|nr:helix-turn-helix domain-containing protein [Kaistia hirudinis]MBB3930058.1 transcriptional regulator with XRE-family HTH domain [Kaistia hirudinis]